MYTSVIKNIEFSVKNAKRETYYSFLSKFEGRNRILMISLNKINK